MVVGLGRLKEFKTALVWTTRPVGALNDAIQAIKLIETLESFSKYTETQWQFISLNVSYKCDRIRINN